MTSFRVRASERSWNLNPSLVLPENFSEEYRALAVEPDVEMYRHGLLQLARRMIAREHHELANLFLAELAKGKDSYAQESGALRAALFGEKSNERWEIRQANCLSQLSQLETPLSIAAGNAAARALHRGWQSLKARRTAGVWYHQVWRGAWAETEFALSGPIYPTLRARGYLTYSVGRLPHGGASLDLENHFALKKSFSKLLRSVRLPSQVSFQVEGQAITLSAQEVLAQASWQFHRLLQLDPQAKAFGGCFDYLAQLAFRETLQHGSPDSLRDLLLIMGGYPNMAGLNAFFRSQGFADTYVLPSLPASRQIIHFESQIRRLPLEESSQNLLLRYLASLDAPTELPAVLRPEHNRLKTLQQEPVFLDSALAWSGFQNAVRHWERHSDWESIFLLERALTQAGASAAPMLLLDFLMKVLVTGDYVEKTALLPKIAELGFGETFRWSDVREALAESRLRNDNLRHAVSEFDASVHSGYLQDVEISRRLALLYHEAASADFEELARRRSAFADRLRQISREWPGPYRAKHILRLLSQNATPASRLAADQIAQGRLDLKILNNFGMRLYWPEASAPPFALFVPPERRLSHEPKIPLIILLDQWSRLLPEARVDYALHLCRCVVHEFAHYVRDFQGGGPGYYRSFGEQLKGEFFATTEDQSYALAQGFAEEWGRAARHPFGWPGYLRAELERAYLVYPRIFSVKS